MGTHEKSDGKPPWTREFPSENGLYDYQGSLYPVGSDTPVDCTPFCRLNVRNAEVITISGEDGQEYDITRTSDGQWRGPVGPVHIPMEDARRRDAGMQPEG